MNKAKPAEQINPGLKNSGIAKGRRPLPSAERSRVYYESDITQTIFVMNTKWSNTYFFKYVEWLRGGSREGLPPPDSARVRKKPVVGEEDERSESSEPATGDCSSKALDGKKASVQLAMWH